MSKYVLNLFLIVICITIYVSKATAGDAVETAVKTENVFFYNGKTKLSASLFIPAAKGLLPAIAITHGSGQDSKSHAGFISFANLLAKEGFVVLIYDKRGVGESSGTYVETPEMAIPAGDLVSAVRFLETRKEVNKERIGVYGHSQGGWVAPLAAAICNDISFVVAACGGGVSVREQNLYSYRADISKLGVTKEGIDSAINFGRHFFRYLATGIDYDLVNPLYENAAKQKWFSFYKQMGFGEKMPLPSMLKNPAFNYFRALQYDPQAALVSLNIPTLVMLAEKDESVPAKIAKQRWEDAYFAGAHIADLTVTIIPEENHYDFERFEGGIRYKPAFADVLKKWLKEKILNDEK